MQLILQEERRKAERAMTEISSNDGVFSDSTNKWLLEMGLRGQLEAKMLYFGQAIRGLMPDCDWLLMEKWANDIVKIDAGMGYFMLGSLYSPGVPGFVNEEKALKYYRLGAEAGHKECQEAIKDLIAANSTITIEYEPQDGEDGPPNPHMLLHYALQDKGEYKEARRFLKLWHKDEPNNTECIIQMAAYYANGLGVTKSYAQAFKYYKLAAEAGNEEGLYYVGLLLKDGNGCKRNVAEAVSYFRKAVQKKYPPAFYQLGFCYELGIGVEQNEAEALKIYKRGKMQHDPECYLRLAQDYIWGTSAEGQNLQKAGQYIDAAIRHTDPDNDLVHHKIKLAIRMMELTQSGKLG